MLRLIWLSAVLIGTHTPVTRSRNEENAEGSTVDRPCARAVWIVSLMCMTWANVSAKSSNGCIVA
jgi:hypothetical protein